MEKGYVENGFIVDLTHAHRTSALIYELSKILDMPEAQNKNICLRLGSMDLGESELTSVKALIETMHSQIEFIVSSSNKTIDSAKALGIGVENIDNCVSAPNINEDKDKCRTTNKELAHALDKIFGDNSAEDYNLVEKMSTTNAANDSEETSGNSTENNTEETASSSVELINFDEPEDLEELRKHDREAELLPTLYIHRTLRSGQSISSDGNIVIIGDVNPGAEIIAKGDITVWGILGGIAHAGSDGSNYAKIRALKMNAIQIRIGKIVARRPDTVNMPYIQRTEFYVPEEARVYKNRIVIHKLHETEE